MPVDRFNTQDIITHLSTFLPGFERLVVDLENLAEILALLRCFLAVFREISIIPEDSVRDLLHLPDIAVCGVGHLHRDANFVIGYYRILHSHTQAEKKLLDCPDSHREGHRPAVIQLACFSLAIEFTDGAFAFQLVSSEFDKASVKVRVGGRFIIDFISFRALFQIIP